MKRYVYILFMVIFLCKTSARVIVYNIGDVARRAQEILIDYDRNGEINCVDKAVAFKLIWDKTYRWHPCQLIRNSNLDANYHHLFVRVFILGRWYYLEPNYKPNRDSYLMEDVWGDRYNPAYNYYGETSYWLDKCGIH